MTGIPPAHSRLSGQSTALLANLVKALAAGKELAEPRDIAALRLDPAALSALVRRAGLESHLAISESEHRVETALRDVLSKIPPQNLSKLLAVLQESEQPAVNHDATYGEAASLGDTGSRPAAHAAFRDVWACATSTSGSSEDDVVDKWRVDDGSTERGGWHRSHMPFDPDHKILPAIPLHPGLIAGLLALAVLVPALLMFASAALQKY